jgi:hypothetical protein
MRLKRATEDDVMPTLTVRSEFESAVDQAVDQLIDIGVGILSIVVVIALARLFVRMVRRIVWKRLGAPSMDPDAATLINNAISLLVYFAAVTLLLALWGASWATLLTALSLSTLAVVLGLQDLLKSLLGGAFVILDQPYSVGDRIAMGEVEGEVTSVGLRTTTVRSAEGHRISIPNAAVLTSPLTNFDRDVTSDTVIILSGVAGNKEAATAQIEAALSADPAIPGAVKVSSTAPIAARTLLRKLSGRSQDARAGSQADAGPLHIVITLTGDGKDRISEHQTVKRMKDVFPGARITVRRGASRS